MTDDRDANHHSSDLTFLSVMDETLSTGIARAGQMFRAIHTDFLVAAQQSDGGFVGPAGPSDLYYTRFALEALAVLGLDSDSPLWRSAGRFLCRHPRRPCNVVDCLSLLQTVSILERRAPEPPEANMKSDCFHQVRSCLDECRAADGGFAGQPRGQVSPYYVFLAALCYDLMGEALPSAAKAAESVLSRRCADGGFSGGIHCGAGQTNQTAAAVALLLMAGTLDEQVAGASGDFLALMQAPDGGLKAAAAAPRADLMSTFTGLYTLALTDRTARLRVGQLGRFVRSLSCPEGGFRPVALGSQADVEYAFYGLGAIGLLGQVARQRS